MLKVSHAAEAKGNKTKEFLFVPQSLLALFRLIPLRLRVTLKCEDFKISLVTFYEFFDCRLIFLPDIFFEHWLFIYFSVYSETKERNFFSRGVVGIANCPAQNTLSPPVEYPITLVPSAGSAFGVCTMCNGGDFKLINFIWWSC